MDDIDDSDEEGEEATNPSTSAPVAHGVPRSKAEHTADLQSMKAKLMGRLASR
jgi:hypothetical protein